MKILETKKEMIEEIFKAKGIWEDGRDIPPFWLKRTKENLYYDYEVALQILADRKKGIITRFPNFC